MTLPTRRAGGRRAGRRTDRFSVERARDRVERFDESTETIAASPRALASATGFAYPGWVFFALPRCFAGYWFALAVGGLAALWVVARA
ncbi:hypothetical protein BRD03_07030 [Halobacteriales archaeon QS_9_68_17]|nr:MAG: hypothetical protein BRD03_07030 [Halobacteriales archaeon QS_9_68_17]